MDKEIEELIELSNIKKSKYQFILLMIGIAFWTTDIIASSSSFLEKMPIVEYKDKNGTIFQEQLSRDTCDSFPNYKIIQKSNHSWVTDFNIECDTYKTAF